MFNKSRQQAETLYYNRCFMIYSLVVVYIAAMVQKCVCRVTSRVLESTIAKITFPGIRNEVVRVILAFLKNWASIFIHLVDPAMKAHHL